MAPIATHRPSPGEARIRVPRFAAEPRPTPARAGGDQPGPAKRICRRPGVALGNAGPSTGGRILTSINDSAALYTVSYI